MTEARPHTIGGLFDRALAAWPQQRVVFPNTSTTLTELDALADRFAALLHDAGVRRGDNVGLLLEPCVDFVAALFGLFRLGATLVPISERSKAHELRHLVTHSDCAALITHGRFPALLAEALPDLERSAPLLRAVLELEGPPADRRAPAAVTAAPGDLAYILYTSGSSAEPKGCMTTHEAVTAQAFSVALTRYMLTPGDVFWCPLPLVHTGGLTTLMACLASGASFVHGGRFEPGVAIDQLERHGCTHAIPAFETIWLRVLDHPRFATADLSRLRVVLNAGTPERLRQLQQRVPQAAQLSTFGATEGGGHISMSFPSDPLELRLNTGGHPLAGMEARVIDHDTGADLPAGVVGEVLYRGVSRFAGYYKNPELEVQAIDADGWFHTGDLGTLDADGRLTYRGRLKDMLKVGGENVSAPEVEAYLLTHPAVNIAAVVGVADARYTEVPAAFVELVPGASCTEEELIAFCRGRISSFKAPRYVRFVDEWPMAGIKIRKFVLRERLERELAAGPMHVTQPNPGVGTA